MIQGSYGALLWFGTIEQVSRAHHTQLSPIFEFLFMSYSLLVGQYLQVREFEKIKGALY